MGNIHNFTAADAALVIQPEVLVGTINEPMAAHTQYITAFKPDYVNAGEVGEQFTYTRDGLLAPVQDPSTPNSDTSDLDDGLTAKLLNREKYPGVMKEYNDTIDTHVKSDAVAFYKTYRSQLRAMGTQIHRSKDIWARRELHKYYGGRTHVTTAVGSSTTSLVVFDTTGFTHKVVNGVLTAVSPSNALNITIDGVANTVTGVTLGTRRDADDTVPGTLTLGTAVTSQSIGDAVIAATAPYSIQAAGDSSYDLASGNKLTYQMIVDAVANLGDSGAMPHMETGMYHFYGSKIHQAQLFADTQFARFFEGRMDSEEFRSGSVFEAGGVMFMFGNQTPDTAGSVTNANTNSIKVRRGLITADGVGLEARYSKWLDEKFIEDNAPFAEVLRNGSQRIKDPVSWTEIVVAPPVNRKQDQIRTTWSYLGDMLAPIDSLNPFGETPDAIYRRAIPVLTS